MLAVFYGNDTHAVREAARSYTQAHAALPLSIDSGTYQPGAVMEAAEGASLFGGTSVVIVDTPSQHDDLAREVEENLDALAASAHRFVVIEGPLAADAKKRYAAHAETVAEHKRPAAERFNVFALGDALAARDKKKLWTLLNDAYRAGLSGEEIAGTLWWQLKTLRLADVTSDAAAAGMKDFPYNKAKRALRGFKDGELAALSESLLSAYHDARQGGLDLDLALERWVLSH